MVKNDIEHIPEPLSAIEEGGFKFIRSHKPHDSEQNQMRIALIGVDAFGEALIDYIEAEETDNYKIVSLFDERKNRVKPVIQGHQVHSNLGQLRRLVEQEAVDAIIVSLYNVSTDRMFEIIQRLGTTMVDIYLPTELRNQDFPWNEYCELGGVAFLRIKGQPFKGFPSLFKAIEDFFISLTALVVLSPVLLLAALAIRMESPGPILIRQLRVGLDGHLFHMLKLRSMYHNPEDDGRVGAVKGDPRVTRVGAFLRSSSIDELPQFINVLRGEMSVIGPRPHVENMLVEDVVYGETVSEYVARHRVKPGITGWAQVKATKVGIHDLKTAQLGVKLDIFYMENWTPWLDIEIIFRTAFGRLFKLFGA